MRFTRLFVGVSGLGLLTAFSLRTAGPPDRRTAPIEITVYRSPTCGCCKNWETYLQKNGFTVKDIQKDDLSDIKAESGVTSKLASCHTAIVGGYVVEGHVPAADIQRMLKEKPKIVGISAPGMPGAGPGMDSGKDPYDVVSFDAKGNTAVWAKH